MYYCGVAMVTLDGDKLERERVCPVWMYVWGYC